MLPGQPELATASAVGLLFVALVVNLVTVLLVVGLLNRYATRSSRPAPGATGDLTPADGRSGSAADRSSGETVVCPECETGNDPGYRYCRACVARLPGRANSAREEVPSFGRFAD
jgi:hypothetical protein